MMKKFLKEYFSFSSREQNGILVLSSLIVILILVNLLISWLPVKRLNKIEEIEEVLEDFKQINECSNDLADRRDNQENPGTFPEANKMFYFDPNRTSKQELMKLGMQEKVAETLLHYLEKGGRFYEKEDLLKIYGMDTSFYTELEPFILITTRDRQANSDNRKSFEAPAGKIIELNNADTTDLLPLKGIGPVLARRVLKYRNLLGGFVTKDQLLEVYGIDKQLFREIYPHVRVDSSLAEKLDLNHSRYVDFIRHPYFNQELVEAILSYRKQQGAIRSASDLLKQGIVTEEEYRKIIPYLSPGEAKK